MRNEIEAKVNCIVGMKNAPIQAELLVFGGCDG
jgi:hypothetical protein